MMKMSEADRVEVIVLDLDGTLFANGTCEYKSPENEDAVKRWKKSGKQLWIATGRGADTFFKLQSMGIYADVMICSCGAGYIVDDQKVKYTYEITDDISKRLFDYLKKNFPDLDYFLDVSPSDHHYGYSGGYHMKRHMKSEFDLCEPNRYLDGNHKLLRLFCVGPDNAYVDHVAEMINHDFSGELHGFRTDQNCIDILNVNCSKGHQLKNLMQITGRKKEEFAAVGDEAADVTLIMEAGIGIAMEDGSEKLIKKADMTVKSVADAIDFLLKEKR